MCLIVSMFDQRVLQSQSKKSKLKKYKFTGVYRKSFLNMNRPMEKIRSGERSQISLTKSVPQHLGLYKSYATVKLSISNNEIKSLFYTCFNRKLKRPNSLSNGILLCLPICKYFFSKVNCEVYNKHVWRERFYYCENVRKQRETYTISEIMMIQRSLVCKRTIWLVKTPLPFYKSF